MNEHMGMMEDQCKYEAILSQKSVTIKVLTEESLQISTEKHVYDGKLKVQEDMENEIQFEKDQLTQKIRPQKKVLEKEL